MAAVCRRYVGRTMEQTRKDAKNEEYARGGLSRQTANGFAWLAMQTVVTKCVTFGGQILLAWLLVPKDFGIVALAYAVAAFIVVFQNSGVLEVLVQREKAFFQNANPAFWLSVTLGAAVAATIALAGQGAAHVFAEPALGGMMAILAVSALLSNFEIVPVARLQIRMRFGMLAILGTGQGIAQIVLAVLFALNGFGPYSFVLPLPLVMLAKLFILWRTADFSVRLDPEIPQWRALSGATGLLIAAALFVAVTQQGAHVILGWFHGTVVVGLFFFAYNLSLQIQTLLSLNLAQVLLPSLSKLQHDAVRQTAAYLRVSRVLIVIGAPTCFLLAAIADPLVRVLFADRWLPAIPVLQWLAVGMAFNLAGIVTLNLLKAQGRYGFHLVACAIRAGVFVAFVTAGAIAGGAVEAGAAVALYMAIHGPGLMYASIRKAGYGWRDVASVFAAPVTVAGIAASVGIGLAGMVPPGDWQNPLRIAVTGVSIGAIYFAAIRLVCPAEWHELSGRTLGAIRSCTGRVVGNHQGV